MSQQYFKYIKSKLVWALLLLAGCQAVHAAATCAADAECRPGSACILVQAACPGDRSSTCLSRQCVVKGSFPVVNCATDKDCQSGWGCVTQRYPCSKTLRAKPRSSVCGAYPSDGGTCVSRSCMPTPRPPSTAREYKDCVTDKDCQRGWICDVESVPCETNPQASECVRKACVPDTQPPARTNERYVTEAVLETGPDDSPALRIQLSWPGSDRVVWTVLHGNTWQRIQRGELQARSSIRTCTGWGSPQSECLQHQGLVVFTTLRSKPGETIQGKLAYKSPQSRQDVVLVFAAVIREGRFCGPLCLERNNPAWIHRFVTMGFRRHHETLPL